MLPDKTSKPRFLFDDVPALGTLREVIPGIDCLRLPLPFALDHVNCWVLRGNGDVSMIDTGINMPDSVACWDSVLASVGQPNNLLVTHFHPDHSGIASRFADAGAKVYSSQIEWEIIEGLHAMDKQAYQDYYASWYSAHGIPQPYIDRVTQAGNTYKRGTLTPPTQCEFLEAGDTIELGGRVFDVLKGQGHSPDMIMLYCQADQLLIAADQVLPSITPNVSLMPRTADANPLLSFLHCLERLAELPEETLVLPSHGLPFRGLHDRIAFLQEHHRARLREIEQALTKEQTAAALFPVLFGRKLDHQQMSFALGETLAHLSYLLHLSRVTQTEQDGVSFFRAVG